MSALVLLLLVFAKPLFKVAGLILAYAVVFPLTLIVQVFRAFFTHHRKMKEIAKAAQ